MQNYFGIGSGCEDRSFFFQFGTNGGSVYKIAIVTDCDFTAMTLHINRLSILQLTGAGGGIANMTDGRVTPQRIQTVFAKDVGNLSHPALANNFLAIADRDA